MEEETVHFISAEPGWKCVYTDESGKLFATGFVIAWRISTSPSHSNRPGDSWNSEAAGVTLDGEVEEAENFFGYLAPDGSVCVPYDRSWDSLADAQKDLRHEPTAAR